MAIAYVPPGVTVTEELTPSVNPLLASPANVCIIGRAQGFVQKTVNVTLTNTDHGDLSVPAEGILSQVPAPVVINGDTPDTYIENTDYSITYANTPVNEIQTVTITGSPGGGNFTLSFLGQTTANIAYSATSSAVQTALQNLSNLDAGDVSVSGSNGGPYTVTFSGQYAGVNVDLLVANGAGLTGGTSPGVTVVQATQGQAGSSIQRVSNGNIPVGTTVRVTYHYLPIDYFVPARLDQISAVEARYGSALASDGTVNSEVSFAALCAFENGASDVVIQPLFRLTDDDNPDSVRNQPTDSQVVDPDTWEESLVPLEDLEDINVVVPAVGQSFTSAVLNDAAQRSILTQVVRHIKIMKDRQQYIVGIFGEDSSRNSTYGSLLTLRDHAETLQALYPDVNEQLIFVSPSKFTRINTITNASFYVGGQYVAAAVAGMLASQPVSQSISREIVNGFVQVADPRSRIDKNADAQAGLLVIEQTGGLVQVRHGITMDNTATARREIPVVRAKHRMIESVRDTLESSVVGRVIADGQAPSVVAAAVGAVLEQLKTQNDLVDYANIQARTLSLDPTTVEVRYSYKPAFPLNYVNVIFSIDLTAGGTLTLGA